MGSTLTSVNCITPFFGWLVRGLRRAYVNALSVCKNSPPMATATKKNRVPDKLASTIRLWLSNMRQDTKFL
jgi:hypothetical protein